MANVKISNLTAAATPVAGTEVLPIVQSGATVKVSIANLTPGLDTITAAKGGTGQTSYAVGDLLYASTTTALSKLADVATGNALISGGVSTAPSYGKIGLTTHVSGTLPTANGGTNLTAFTANGVVYASSTSALTTGSALVFDGSNLGVGVTPSAWSGARALEMGGGSNASYIAFNNTGTLQSYLYWNAFYNGTNNIYKATGRSNVYGVNASGEFVWFNAPSGTAGNTISFTQAMTLDASGNLLVGTTSSNARITVKASGNAYSTGALALVGATSGTSYITNASGNLYFSNNGSTDHMVLDSSGNLLVGTTSNLSSRFGVQGASATNADYAIYCQNSSASVLFGTRNDGLFFTGTTTNAPYNFATSGGKALYVNSSGQIGYNSSLREHKTNIVQAPSVDWLDQLNVVSFNYRKRSEDGVYTEEAQGETLWGVIADDAVAVKPDFCSYDSKGNLDGFHYDRLIAPLLKRVQEQQAIITQLQADVAALKGA